jgi:cyclin B
VSALEDISSDASRLSSNRTKILPSSASSLNSTVTSSQASIFTQASDSSISSDIFEDAISRKLPKGVQHFDRENWNDPFQVSHYAMDIFEYLKHQEAKYQIKDYMSQQPELTKWMRSLLVDWMVEVQESFELNHETLYLAIKIVDTYLGRERVSKDSLQLLGAAALLIACKYDVSSYYFLFLVLCAHKSVSLFICRNVHRHLLMTFCLYVMGLIKEINCLKWKQTYFG